MTRFRKDITNQAGSVCKHGARRETEHEAHAAGVLDHVAMDWKRRKAG